MQRLQARRRRYRPNGRVAPTRREIVPPWVPVRRTVARPRELAVIIRETGICTRDRPARPTMARRVHTEPAFAPAGRVAGRRLRIDKSLAC